MISAYLMAHCDDEYAAWPLLCADLRAGRKVMILHLTAPADPRLAARRRAESSAFVRNLGPGDIEIIDLSASTGAQDGRLLAKLEQSLNVLLDLVQGRGKATILTTPAWEGGHLDHDLTAAIAVAFAGLQSPRPRLRQISLYHGYRLPGQLFRTSPLDDGGPVERVHLPPRDWLDFALAARAYASQAAVLSTWWPSLFWSYLRHGYQVQTLAPARVLARPHSGPLLYERRGRGDYLSVARRITQLFDHAAHLGSAAAAHLNS